MRCAVIRGDAWLVLLSPCNTTVTRHVRAHPCVRETWVRRLRAAWGVTVYGIILPYAREMEYDLVLLGLHCDLRLAHAL